MTLNFNERKRKHDLRTIWNAIIHFVKAGCQWRFLPDDFPKWQLVYYYYSKWANLTHLISMCIFYQDIGLLYYQQDKNVAQSNHLNLVEYKLSLVVVFSALTDIKPYLVGMILKKER